MGKKRVKIIINKIKVIIRKKKVGDNYFKTFFNLRILRFFEIIKLENEIVIFEIIFGIMVHG
jgi:hypothetical protein